MHAKIRESSPFSRPLFAAKRLSALASHARMALASARTRMAIARGQPAGPKW